MIRGIAHASLSRTTDASSTRTAGHREVPGGFILSAGVVFWGTPNGLRRRDADASNDASNDAGIRSMSELGAPVAGLRIAGGRLHCTARTERRR